MKMIGARALIECLKKEQVQVVFGYPGGSVLTLYNELDQSDITHVLTGHEQGAVHAADGYARATGHTGVAFATSGPGVCNMVTGIATAAMDSIPLVVISGQVATTLIGRDSFQEADISGITTPITKHNYLVKNVIFQEPFLSIHQGLSRLQLYILSMILELQITPFRCYKDFYFALPGRSFIRPNVRETFNKQKPSIIMCHPTSISSRE